MPASLQERYEILEEIGRGHAGFVHAAFDRLLGRPVAIKTFRGLGGSQLYWLKKEFRSIAEVSHPNLVELYDLVVDAGKCFFTMELVDGVDFLTRFRGAGSSPPVDHHGLRDGLLQLASGLEALHERQMLHRDIKPQNVLVDSNGRVVVLDFDLVADTAAFGLLSESSVQGFAGTPEYMAPEQLQGRPSSRASDWYAMGAMAFEVLTGQTPFGGERRMRAMTADWTVPAPRDLAPETPTDLDLLVRRLLEPTPEGRGNADTVRAVLSSSPPGSRAMGPTLRSALSPLTGRERELAVLQDAYARSRASTATTVAIEGPAGIGKTALVEHFLRSVEAKGDVLVLRGRSHPGELVPFRALDAAIDDLHQYLEHHDPETRTALLGDGSQVLARLFPVFHDFLDRVDDNTDVSREARQRAFTALRELLRRVADRTPIVLWLDDLHWGDLDSAALLRELRRAPHPPSMFVVLSYRGANDGGPEGARDVLALVKEAEAGLEPSQETVVLALGGLEAGRARALAANAARSGELTGKDLDAVVAEADGNPLLLLELARHCSQGEGPDPASSAVVRLAEIVRQRLGELPADARRIVELCAVWHGPIAEDLLYSSGGSPEETRRAIAALRAELLVRRVSRERRPALDVFHARIRDAVLDGRSAESLQDLHRGALAMAMQAEAPDPFLLVHLHLGAGDRSRAASQALAAAERLRSALAPHAAAAMYRKALELGGGGAPEWKLQAELGRSLVLAGIGGEGARWLAIAAQSLETANGGGPEVLSLRRNAAEQALRSGLHGEGLEALRKVLAARRIWYPPSEPAALASMIVQRARAAAFFRLHPRAGGGSPSESEREDLETYWSAGVGLSLFDGVRAADFNVRHAMLAHRVGDLAHMARATASDGMILAWEGGSRRRHRSRLRLAQGKELAEQSGNPNALAHALLMQGASAYMEARWADAIALAAETEDLCESRCQGAAWELANAHVMTGNSLACLGQMRRLREHLPQMLRKARERDDQYLLVTGRLGHANSVWLASDRPDEARRQADDALAGPFPPGYAWQVYQGALAIGQVELYEGRPQAGWEHTQRARAKMRASHMLRFMPTRVEILDLQARCALAIAAGTHDTGERERKLAFAERAQRAIAREDAPWVAPFAAALAGGAAALRGDRVAAARSYQSAGEGFAALGMRLHACGVAVAAQRFELDFACGVEEADTVSFLDEQGIADPKRMARVYAPH